MTKFILTETAQDLETGFRSTGSEPDALATVASNNVSPIPGSIAPLQLPDQEAPDLNGFLSGHGINSGDTGSSGPTGGIDLPGFGNGSDNDQGSHLPGSGGNGDPGVPDGVHFGDGSISGGLGVPDGINFGDGSISGGLGVPKGLDFGDGISGSPGVPSDVGGGGGITGPGVPNGSGSVGVGGFKPSDFDNGHLTDAPDDGGSGGGSNSSGSWWSSAWSNLSHGHVASAGWDAATAIVADGMSRANNGDHLAGGMEQAVGGLVGAATAGAVAVVVGPAGPIGVAVAAGASAVTPAPAPAPDPDPDPAPAPNPDPGKGNQPVDDSGTGPSHPTTHNNEQPVDDSGTGPVHPMTSTTAQPVDDSGVDPSHPGTHLGAEAISAQNVASANLVAIPVDDGETSGHGNDVGVGHSFGGHSGAFWNSVALTVADSQQHASAATTDAPAAVASAPVAPNGSLGIFEHSASLSFAASAPAADGHANMDALATTHIAGAHVEAETSHSFEIALDLSHVASHM